MKSKWVGTPSSADQGAISSHLRVLKVVVTTRLRRTPRPAGRSRPRYHHGIPNLNFLFHVELWAFIVPSWFSPLSSTPGSVPLSPRLPSLRKSLLLLTSSPIAIQLGSFPATYALYSSPVSADPSPGCALFMSSAASRSWSRCSSGRAVAPGGRRVRASLRRNPALAGRIGGRDRRGGGPGFILGEAAQVAPTLAWFKHWMLVASVTLFVQAPRGVGEKQPAPRAIVAGAV